MKEEAAAVLAAMGLTVSDAVRLLLTHVAQEKALPFAPLERRHHDHALSGDWRDHRDCHVKPDLVLIYQQPDAATLRLVRLGSHSELGF